MLLSFSKKHRVCSINAGVFSPSLANRTAFVSTMDFRTRTLTSLAFFLALLPAGYLVIAIVVNGPGALPQPPPATVPGTDAPLRLQYTGVAPVDKLLVTLFRFFWPALDGASPGASFFLASFAGEIPGVWSLLMLEGIRPGNRGRVIS